VGDKFSSTLMGGHIWQRAWIHPKNLEVNNNRIPETSRRLNDFVITGYSSCTRTCLIHVCCCCRVIHIIWWYWSTVLWLTAIFLQMPYA